MSKQEICDICGKVCGRVSFDIDCYIMKEINLCYDCGKVLLDIIHKPNKSYTIVLQGGSE